MRQCGVCRSKQATRRVILSSQYMCEDCLENLGILLSATDPIFTGEGSMVPEEYKALLATGWEPPQCCSNRFGVRCTAKATRATGGPEPKEYYCNIHAGNRITFPLSELPRDVATMNGDLKPVSECNAYRCNFSGCDKKVEWRSKNQTVYLCDVHQSSYPASMFERFSSEIFNGEIKVDVNNGQESGFSLLPALIAANDLGFSQRRLLSAAWEKGVPRETAKLVMAYQTEDMPIQDASDLAVTKQRLNTAEASVRALKGAEQRRDIEMVDLRKSLNDVRKSIDEKVAIIRRQSETIKEYEQTIERQRRMLADSRLEVYELPDLGDLQ